MKNIKSLLPYCSFSLLYILINDYGTIEELKTVILSVSYTKNILSAIPTTDKRRERNTVILEGDIPSPIKPPSGCKFHTRCKECMNACKFVEPKFIEHEPNHFVACHLYDMEIMNNLEKYDLEYEKMIQEENELKENENKE